MYKSVLSIRIISLYETQHSSLVFACKTATFGAELKVSMCTRPHLSFSACKSAWLAPETLVSMGSSPLCGFCMQNSEFCIRITNLYESQTSPVVLCIQTSVISSRNTCLYLSQFFLHTKATFWAELQLSMGPRPHLSFSTCKTAWIASE